MKDISTKVIAAWDDYLSGNKADSLKDADSLGASANSIINLAIGLIGFIAVVMVIYGGLQYTMSAGDAGKVTKAKNTILYGIVGLVIAILAYAIVNFVIQKIIA